LPGNFADEGEQKEYFFDRRHGNSEPLKEQWIKAHDALLKVKDADNVEDRRTALKSFQKVMVDEEAKLEAGGSIIAKKT